MSDNKWGMCVHNKVGYCYECGNIPEESHPYEALQAELDEQCRLNGMGSEREARLMAKVAELERERDRLNAKLIVAFDALEEAQYSCEMIQAQMGSGDSLSRNRNTLNYVSYALKTIGKSNV